jgi:hypothetical protein
MTNFRTSIRSGASLALAAAFAAALALLPATAPAAPTDTAIEEADAVSIGDLPPDLVARLQQLLRLKSYEKCPVLLMVGPCAKSAATPAHDELFDLVGAER